METGLVIWIKETSLILVRDPELAEDVADDEQEQKLGRRLRGSKLSRLDLDQHNDRRRHVRSSSNY